LKHFAAVVCALMLSRAGTVAAAGFAWPHGERAAVSLSYDDAIDSQLDNAIPALDRRGLKASFYLTLSSPTLVRRLPEWRAAAAHGHELGNHTLFHQCSRSAPGHEWVTAENDLDTTPVAQLAAQVRVGNAMLQAIDGRRERTFTVPCGDLLAAGQPYLPAIRGEFVAIKSGAGGVLPDMLTLDPYSVPVLAPSEVTGEYLIEQVKAAQARGTMINFTFHGIGGDYLSISNKAHEQLLDYLAAHRAQVWTATFIDVMKHVKLQQKNPDAAP
jgi:peptidoglycan/xylan/chitin deacetylase (PgdA/CDA1 family)